MSCGRSRWLVSLMDVFDTDAWIGAAVPGHPLGRRVAALFDAAAGGALVGAGSVLLLPDLLGKPLPDGAADEVRVLAGLLAQNRPASS